MARILVVRPVTERLIRRGLLRGLSELSPSEGLDPSRLNGLGWWLSVMQSSVTQDRAH